MRLSLIIIFILFFPVVTIADILTGSVVRIVDGDTIVVRDINKAQYEIRLAGIDAPELDQAYGSKSKENLSGLVAGRFVVVAYKRRDSDGRIVGQVLLAGQDMNLEQIKAGLAWFYTKDARDQTEYEHELYVLAEVEARKAGRGLWFDVNPVPPWVFRR